jgi:HEAT repeat protein
VKLPVTLHYELGEPESESQFQERIAKIQAEQRTQQQSELQRDKSADVREIIKALKDPSRRAELSIALSKLHSIPPIPELREEVAALLDKLIVSKDSGTRMSAQMAIQKWGTEKNVPTLLKLLDSLDSSSRRTATEALGEISRDPDVAKRLAEELLEGNSTDRYGLQDALKKMGSVAENAVLALLKEDDEDVRKSALEILGDIGTRKSVDEIQALARNRSNSSVRYAAESALRQMERRFGAQNNGRGRP